MAKHANLSKSQADAIAVIDECMRAIIQQNPQKIMQTSNKTIHNASVFQDKYSLQTALVAYSIAKLIEHKLNKNITVNFTKYNALLQKIRNAVQSEKTDEFTQAVEHLYKSVSAHKKELAEEIRGIRSHAQLNKSAKIYYHGISAGQSASILGVSPWQFYKYIGYAQIYDDGSDAVSHMKKRLHNAHIMFSPSPNIDAKASVFANLSSIQDNKDQRTQKTKKTTRGDTT